MIFGKLPNSYWETLKPNQRTNHDKWTYAVMPFLHSFYLTNKLTIYLLNKSHVIGEKGCITIYTGCWVDGSINLSIHIRMQINDTHNFWNLEIFAIWFHMGGCIYQEMRIQQISQFRRILKVGRLRAHAEWKEEGKRYWLHRKKLIPFGSFVRAPYTGGPGQPSIMRNVCRWGFDRERRNWLSISVAGEFPSRSIQPSTSSGGLRLANGVPIERLKWILKSFSQSLTFKLHTFFLSVNLYKGNTRLQLSPLFNRLRMLSFFPQTFSWG